MKFLILLFLLLLLSLWLGLEMAQDTGYVLIIYHHWSIETTLWVALISLIVLFLFLYFIFRLLRRAIHLSKNMQRWRKMRLYRRGRHLTNTGLFELAKGRWQRAEQTLTKSAKMIRSPLINYLSAAQAANAQQAYERRDNYLRLAHATTKGSAIAVGLTQAQLQICNHQWEQALATLQHLDQKDSHHEYTLKLLKQVYLKLQDWQNLRLLFPGLRKFKVEPPETLSALEKETYINLLAEAYQKGKQPLIKAWESLPRHFQQDVDLIEPYTRYLITLNEADRAIPLIEHTLKKMESSSGYDLWFSAPY
ncbi:heme biosynthesis HemY N-terminal domain-containing protein [Coxiella-like endosymbiont]|uniref:heme biosynthesis HemY N-terminal domain-containing protein n=1 Tax=Coxiella-like endosymbiont TaxID=1592897 RepID=UPI002729584B|nr:heme biosynthesis HemY N-terminal domain-containing protein [Coxiella-like endosymbiont]